MSLDELLDLIAHSDADTWHLVQAGTTYTDRFNVIALGGGATAVDVDQHLGLAVYRPDVDVRIAWGIRRDDIGTTQQFSPPERPEWNTHGITRDARAALLDVFYRGALVYRTTYYWVDGGNLPYPRSRQIEGQTRQVASRQESALVGLVEALSEGSAAGYWSRLEQVGFLLVDEELEDPNRY